jgi:hypothetical protein
MATATTASSRKSPLALAKEKFGDKEKLVAAVQSFANDGELWLSRTNAGKGLAHVSNAKLLRLHATFTEVKAKFGSRAKLIDAILDLEKRVKDAGYKTRLNAWPVPRLWDYFKAAEKRVKGAAKAVAKKTAPKAAKKTAAGEGKDGAAKKPAANKTATKAPAKKTAAKKVK